MTAYVTTNYPTNYAILIHNNIVYYKSKMFNAFYIDTSYGRNVLEPYLFKIKIKI